MVFFYWLVVGVIEFLVLCFFRWSVGVFVEIVYCDDDVCFIGYFFGVKFWILVFKGNFNFFYGFFCEWIYFFGRFCFGVYGFEFWIIVKMVEECFCYLVFCGVFDVDEEDEFFFYFFY